MTLAIWILFTLLVLYLLVWSINFHPWPLQTEKVIDRQGKKSEEPPVLAKGQKIRVLCWNVQFFAGKEKVFLYDVPGFNGPDWATDEHEVTQSLKGIAGVIREQNPDILVLQELDWGAKRTQKRKQLLELLELLPDEYRVYTKTFYWKSLFVPHPKIMGSVGFQLAVISKFRIEAAQRHQLPMKKENWFRRSFNFKRAILEVILPVRGGRPLKIFNTHLDAFTDFQTQNAQVGFVHHLLRSETERSNSWIIGGDFNQTATQEAYERLRKVERDAFSSNVPMESLLKDYPSFPSIEDMKNSPENYFTYFGNDPDLIKPDRTIDYILHSPKIGFQSGKVLQSAIGLSDHFPLVVDVAISG